MRTQSTVSESKPTTNFSNGVTSASSNAKHGRPARRGVAGSARVLAMASMCAAACWSMPTVIVGATLVATVFSRSALAQARPVDPYVAVVTTATTLRAGDATLYYPVANVPVNTMLRVDGESGNWLRVSYPAGGRALVRPDECSPSADNTTVRLTKPSTLRALNVEIGERGSFFPLLQAPLASGTEFKVLDTLKDDGGRISAYIVAVPSEARGFIAAGNTRRASPEESAQFLGTGNAASGANAAPATTPSAPAAAPTAAPAATTAPTAPAATTPPAEPASTPTTPSPAAPTGSAPVEIVVPPTGDRTGTGTAAPSAPAFVPATPGAAGETPAAPVTTTPPTPPAPPAPPKPNPVDVLVQQYERVRQQPLMEAELDSAITEFRNYIGTLGGNPGDENLRRRLGKFVEAMELRMQVREAMRSRQETSRTLDTQQQRIGQQLTELSNSRVYAYIGRLIPSVVYDGQRLPLMYRIQSPEPGTGRTIGYLVPDPKLDLQSKLGAIVGIQGESRFEDSMNAMIVVPTRVDVVNLQPVRSSTPSGPVNPGTLEGSPVTPVPTPTEP